MWFKALKPGYISPFHGYQYNPIGEWTETDEACIPGSSGLHVGDEFLAAYVLELTQEYPPGEETHSFTDWVGNAYRGCHVYQVEVEHYATDIFVAAAQRVKLVAEVTTEKTQLMEILRELKERYVHISR